MAAASTYRLHGWLTVPDLRTVAVKAYLLIVHPNAQYYARLLHHAHM